MEALWKRSVSSGPLHPPSRRPESPVNTGFTATAPASTHSCADLFTQEITVRIRLGVPPESPVVTGFPLGAVALHTVQTGSDGSAMEAVVRATVGPGATCRCQRAGR